MAIKRIFRFLGGLRFAIVLITLTAGIVIMGTFLESYTQSHLFAEKFTYKNPLFIFLLYLYFLNILLATLRRWPFRIKHIPFILTHIGLLMIIAGVIIKHHFGLQGMMAITEGSASSKVILPNTYALQIKRRGETKGNIYPLNQMTFDDGLKITQVGWSPHSQESWQTWFKGNFCSIKGLPLLPIKQWEPGQEIIGTPIWVYSTDPSPWYFYIYRSSQPEALLKEIQLEPLPGVALVEDTKGNIEISLLERDGKVIHHQSLQENLSPLYMHDEGFGGYSTQCNTPLSPLPKTPRLIAAAKEYNQRLPSPTRAQEELLLRQFFEAQTHSTQLQAEEKQKLQEIIETPSFFLETEIYKQITPVESLPKLEENVPMVTLLFEQNDKKELRNFRYDASTTGMEWPVLDGLYLVRFQPLTIEIPHHIRLHAARNIAYANSTQPYSYEADISLGKYKKTISMNHVMETEDGYRFYLANIKPANERHSARIQLAVNKDPGKYFLTYPGGVILSLGIILLLWLKPYKRNE